MAEDVQNTILNLEDEGNELEEIITTNPTLDPEELTKELDDLLLKWESEDQPSQEKFEEYISKFEEQLAEELIVVGGASLDEIKNEEIKLQEIELDTRKQRADLEKSVAEQELRREREAQLRLQYEIRRRKQEIDRKKQLFLLQQRIQREKMRQAMKKSESHLKWALGIRKGEVQKEYGNLSPQTGTVSATLSALPKWSVEWKHTPQPVKINIVSVRGVKDKLPPGKYVIVTSVYDHMAGHALRWSAWENKKKTGQATLPVGHDGRFNRAELKFDQDLYCALPAKEDMKPAMVFTFELFMLRGDLSPFDRVVAWGAFPICNEHFDIVQGKCKVPLLRGPMRQNIDRFSKIQTLMHKDLDNWLANLYFEVKLLPKYIAGQKEFRVQTKFKQSTVAILDRVRQFTRPNKYRALSETTDGDSDNNDGDDNSEENSENAEIEEFNNNGDFENWWKNTDDNNRAHMETDKKGAIVSPTVAKMSGNTTIAMPFIPEILRKQQESGIKEVYSRRHNFDPDQAYTDQAEDLMTAHEDRLGHNIYEKWQNEPKTSSYTERLEQHLVAIRRRETNLGRHSNVLFERTRFVARMFVGELGLLYFNSLEFWWTILLLVIFWFVRLYLHYFGQYAFLKVLGVEPSVFNFAEPVPGVTVTLNYQTDQLSLGATTGLVLFGPLFIILIYSVAMVFFWLAQKVFLGLPFVISKVMLAFGIWAIIDCVMILIVDACLKRYTCLDTIGDGFKLYCYLKDSTSQGGLGIPITILLYLGILILSTSLVYIYLLMLHNNGRMLDCWWRLTSKENVFLVPYDLEISQQQLAYLVNKAEQWRGPDGERRKCTIYDYVIEADEILRKIERSDATLDSNSLNRSRSVTREIPEANIEIQSQVVETGLKEVTTHTAIYTLHLDGLKELYRQFLRLPDGSIVEIFGDIATAMLGSPDLKAALIRKQRQMEDDLDEEIEQIESAKRGFMSRFRMSGIVEEEEPEEINMDEIDNKVQDVSRGKTVTLRRRPTANSITQNVENLDTVQEDNYQNTTIENSHATTIV